MLKKNEWVLLEDNASGKVSSLSCEIENENSRLVSESLDN